MNMTHDASATTLLIAKSIAGGIDALARHLRVPKKQLASWIEGEVDTPPTVVVRCVDFLAGAHPK
jgi:hypothetical protein